MTEMSSSPQIILTGDGSHTLYNAELNETYHSRHGARQESIHVFVTHGLEYLCGSRKLSEPIRLLEVGFGTGLNALLTFQFAERTGRRIHYTALEPFPIEEATWSQLNFISPDHVNRNIFDALHSSEWGREIVLAPLFSLTKQRTQLLSAPWENESFDLIFFDAFAPSKQPEMWIIEALGKSIEMLRHGGVWVTYCAKGQVKRDLRNLGCKVVTLPGPPGKMEMIRAEKP